MGSGYEIRDGHQRLKQPDSFITKKGALVSTCGLHEMDNFELFSIKTQIRRNLKTW